MFHHVFPKKIPGIAFVPQDDQAELVFHQVTEPFPVIHGCRCNLKRRNVSFQCDQGMNLEAKIGLFFRWALSIIGPIRTEGVAITRPSKLTDRKRKAVDYKKRLYNIMYSKKFLEKDNIDMTNFIEWLKKSNWEFKLKEDNFFILPDDVLNRYKEIPKAYLEFLKIFRECVSPDEKTWFLCEDDYENMTSAFKWNEFEIIGLEAAREDSDEEWEKEIKEWWDSHFPIIISVKNGYAFYAIDMSTDTGEIVYGIEPEFEETEKVAENIQDFFRLVVENKIVL